MNKVKPGKPRLTKRGWIWIGGLAGLVAILSLLVAGGDAIQNYVAQRSADAAQATMIAIMDAQLVVQTTLAAYESSQVESGPTATAVSQRIAQLESTREALEVLRAKVEPTLTAFASVPVGTPPPDASRGQVASQVAGVNAELLEFGRFQNMVTAKIRWTNSGDSKQTIWPTDNSYLLDEATQIKYRMTEQSNYSGEIPVGESIDVWAKYALPQADQPRYLSLILNHGVLFEHLEVK
ncbi:MAG: hypothetical protein JXA09_07720 [Anaerolineae bacterium]|nr:hypothetical protein [Anaerolineae bacterium]